MLITVNGAPLCELPEKQLPEVVQLLGKDSFTFTLDQAQATFNLLLPFQCCQVILEASDASIIEVLAITAQRLQQAHLLPIRLIQNEKERVEAVQQLKAHLPCIWLSFDYDPKLTRAVVQYSWQQMKWSKQLAQTLEKYLTGIIPVHVQGYPSNWKQAVHSLLHSSDKSVASVRLVVVNPTMLIIHQAEQVAAAIAQAIIRLYTDKPVLQLFQSLKALASLPSVESLSAEGRDEPSQPDIEEASDAMAAYDELVQPMIDNEEVEQETQDAMRVSTNLEEEATAVGNACEPDPEPLHDAQDMEADEKSFASISREIELNHDNFFMMQAYKMNNERATRPANTSQISFISYMNQMASGKRSDGKQLKPRSYNILTERMKSRRT